METQKRLALAVESAASCKNQKSRGETLSSTAAFCFEAAIHLAQVLSPTTELNLVDTR